jgi:beta-galactosidase
MWSIGNEIVEQMREDGWRVAKLLYDATKALDPTRPTTAGCNFYPECFDNKIALTVDIAGLNYKPQRYKEVREKYPDIILLGSETESCVSTRGCYDLPAKIVIGDPSNDNLTVSDYGLCAPPWAYYAERELAIQEDCPDVLGEFVWTGFDYLGEPTPYYDAWPSRSSYFGVVDLAGLPKNRYYAYRVAWSELPTLHIFPHWNFEGREGEVVPVHIYSSYEEVELFINGVSQGRRRRKTGGFEPWDEIERFRLVWQDTVYTPGEVLAVAYEGGREVARKAIRTAGEPYRIELSAYYKKLSADGESLNFITAKILDKDGNLCPKADNRLTFTAEGGVCVYATDAGDQRECETFLRPDKKALCGMLVASVKSCGKAEKATVYCSADGLISGSVAFECV